MSSQSSIVSVNLGPRSYDIHVGPALLDRLGSLVRNVSDARQITLVTDKNVARHYSKRTVDALESDGFATGTITIPPGESSKSLAMAARLYDGLAERQRGRCDPIVALGGGVVGDLAGFVAATWMRGVPFVQCPTTTESMIDAGVGGKTAVNHESGKNLIGAFHQPRVVVMDTDTLATLDARDFVAGLAESVKHALIADADFLVWHENHGRKILERDPGTLRELIVRNCRIKASVVERDERETSPTDVGRAALNFGHTIGHALESLSQGSLRHGEAVSLGMIAALNLSTELVNAPPTILEQAMRSLGSLQLPTCTKVTPTMESILARIRLDKKNTDKIRFVLLKKVANPTWYSIVKTQPIEAAVKRLIAP